MAIHTALNDGTPVCIRRVNRADEARSKRGIAQLSPQSRYLRFFSGMREAPPHVLRLLVSPDGHNHLAWGRCGAMRPIPRRWVWSTPFATRTTRKPPNSRSR
jgi:hypothetical protein